MSVSEASRAPGGRPNQGRVGTVVNGKWYIDARIGSGGMATVYAATHRNGHRAALKMLHTTLSRDESIRTRFLREGYVANAVAHPGVVRVDDDGVTEDGAAFLVLELLDGETIEARRTRQGGMLAMEEVLEIADQALDALAAAHEKGIIHRDVKPDNIFLCWNGEVKLLDFGLARMKELRVEDTKTGVTIGTPEFMSPEQAQGRRDAVDARSDLWALGATLFTALTGKCVHNATSLHEQLVANATLRPRSVRALAPHVLPSVAIVIDRALELDRPDRWESASEMQRALRAARPRTERASFALAESLTMPAASPASLKRGAAAMPQSGSRPSSNPSGAPATDRTIDLSAPSSDPTIEEPAPMTIQLDELPTSSIEPISPVPHTERLAGTGTRGSGAILQAQSALAQAAQSQSAFSSQPSAEQMVITPRMVGVPPRFDSTLESQPDPNLARAPTPPLLSSSGVRYPLVGSGGPPGLSSGPYPTLGSNSYPSQGGTPPTTLGSGPYPTLASGAFSSLEAPAGATRGSGPPAPPALRPDHSPVGVGAPAGPVSIRTRRSVRRVVSISLLLIAVCAAIGAWVLLHPLTRGH